MFSRSKHNHTDEVHDEELEARRVTGTDSEEHDPEDHDMVEPQKPKEPPREVITYKRRSVWAREIIQDAKKYGAPNGSLRESKRPRTYSSYVALLSDIINARPSSYEEVVEKKVWKDVMLEEYQSIMKNDVRDVVSRLEGKSVVTSKWIYKIKHATDGSIEKYKARSVARGFSLKE